MESLGSDRYFIDAFACDSCPKVRNVLETNFRALHKGNIFHDVKTLDFDKIKLECPQLHIFTAGFPCQPFSPAGSSQGTLDMRGTIVFDVIRGIKQILPKTFLLENVPELKYRHPETFHQILNALVNIKSQGEAHYHISWKILNTRIHVGSAPNRPRIYIIGIAQDLVSSNYSFKWPGEASFPQPQCPPSHHPLVCIIAF